MALLAASGGDTVKLFDVSVKPGDPCSLSYTPSPGFQVNSVKWNHTSESICALFPFRVHRIFNIFLEGFAFVEFRCLFIILLLEN